MRHRRLWRQLADALLTQFSDSKPVLCLLCGDKTVLSYEHIPPKSCYNDSCIRTHTFYSMIKQHQSREKFPRGLGRKSLCRDCNTRLGREYVPAFKSWTEQGMDLLIKGAGLHPIDCPFTIKPGSIIRQVASMAVALGDEWMIKNRWFDRLKQMVFNPSVSLVPNDFRFFVYLIGDGEPRLAGFATPVKIADIAHPMVQCEVALPPFGYVVIHNDENTTELARRIGLCDITNFMTYPSSQTTTVFLRLRKLRPIGPSPLDYEMVTAVKSSTAQKP